MSSPIAAADSCDQFKMWDAHTQIEMILLPERKLIHASIPGKQNEENIYYRQ